ncbi:hypothetical protein BHE74_00035312 [Ensete ventricosum]|nr:hypothetical protein BHE74_00035312 [Ensete ventricosum]
MRDPVYGCTGVVFQLQNQVSELQAQLALAQAAVANLHAENANLTALICERMSHALQETTAVTVDGTAATPYVFQNDSSTVTAATPYVLQNDSFFLDGSSDRTRTLVTSTASDGTPCGSPDPPIYPPRATKIQGGNFTSGDLNSSTICPSALESLLPSTQFDSLFRLEPATSKRR